MIRQTPFAPVVSRTYRRTGGKLGPDGGTGPLGSLGKLIAANPYGLLSPGVRRRAQLMEQHSSSITAQTIMIPRSLREPTLAMIFLRGQHRTILYGSFLSFLSRIYARTAVDARSHAINALDRE
ncbi:hypothetical protein BHE74_00022548 [Ensete ventricosum]|nr:hypothetical protein GW17_00046326 [Ensete ventricosum]RWW69819.1 hypothetical protein BHE74_00022548 [Ensete ventricosum]